jgi:hypothetical protein
VGCCDAQETLVSLLDDRDLLALRLVSRKTREWVDAVLPSHPTKALTLYVDKNKKKTLHELMEDEIARGIPFFRRLNVRDSSFFSHPLTPSFLRIYSSQLHTVYHCYDGSDVAPEEVAFYEALPNLTQLSTNWLGDSVADGKLPALQRLQLHTEPSVLSKRAVGTIDFHFLLNFPNLTQLWLPYMRIIQEVQVLSALGPYVKKWNGLEGSSRRTLTIFLRPYDDFPSELTTAEKEQVAVLLQELAVADGRILIEKMNVKLLDEAVRHFYHQRGGQFLLSSFGKCIRSLWGFSSSLYEVELPNMRKWNVFPALAGTARDGDYSRTVSWPKLEEVNLIMRNEGLAKLVFGSGVFRPSVKRLLCSLTLLSQGSKEARLSLANFPNLTHLTLNVNAEVGLFRSVMRVLPTSCSKIQFLQLNAFFPLEDEDLLGVDGKEGLKLTPPPLLQLPGKYKSCNKISRNGYVLIPTCFRNSHLYFSLEVAGDKLLCQLPSPRKR